MCRWEARSVQQAPETDAEISAYTGVALLFAAGAILWYVNQRATEQAENQAVTRAQFIADALLGEAAEEARAERGHAAAAEGRSGRAR